MKNKETRLSHKLDTIFWWILRLLPLIIFFIFNAGAAFSKANWQYTIDDGDINSFTAFYFQDIFSFIGLSSFNTLSFNVLNACFGGDGVFPLFYSTVGAGLFEYLAYCVSIEILRVVYNIFVFFIRWAYRAIENIGR